MKKSVLLFIWMTLLSVAVTAQDFASRYMLSHKEDKHLKCVTISPTMMEEIMKNNNGEKDDDVLKIISNLRSMQMITSKTRGLHYFREALKVVEKSGKRFEPFLSFRDKSENCRIMVRKHNEAIIELVMMMYEKEQFTVINFTGKMNAEFISKLANSIKPKRS